MAQPKRQRTSFVLVLKKLWCFVARHEAPVPVGALHRKGFAPAQVYQCPFCNEFFMQFHTLKRLGGREAS